MLRMFEAMQPFYTADGKIVLCIGMNGDEEKTSLISVLVM